jgi:dTDP-4-amino-4,6-dideoxygalactose transaminase
MKQIWKSHRLTNNGPLSVLLENKLKKYFKVRHLFFVSNGTMALQMAIRALDLKGEIITTPFTYVATATSIVWEHCVPVFVDINKEAFTIDPKRIEKAITPKTCAIMGVHVYGYPCDVRAIGKIAKKHRLKVIYDAAHAFGTMYRNKSLVSYGDVSTLSFHATKLFHTVEGGAVITNNDNIAKKISLYRAFGHVGDTYYTFGINGKNSEFHAAMGLSIFPKITLIMKRRKYISNLYDSHFRKTKLLLPKPIENTVHNYSYYPVLFPTKRSLKKAVNQLHKFNIFPRRYFYPSLNTLPYLHPSSCPISESVSSRILCLPIYPELSKTSIDHIAYIVNSGFKSNK